MERTRVLVVDDDDAMRAVVSTVLRRSDMHVGEAENVDEALEKLENERFDCVLTDKNLPGRSGLDLIRLVRQSGADIAVILMTAYPTSEALTETVNLAVDAYLEKPFPDIFVVASLIREVLARRGVELPPVRDGALRVLVVALDDADARDRLAAPLSGLEVQWASDDADVVARAASEIRREERPDLVILDLDGLPKIAAILPRLRAAAPAAALVLVAERPLDMEFHRSLVSLRVRGLFSPAEYPRLIAEVVTDLRRG